MEQKVKVHFLGASGTVTGSKYLIETGEYNLMIDCGLFQGLKELRSNNWDDLPVDVQTINVVLLTHGHMDHTGYLPKLVKSGFRGQILGTRPTLEIASVILRDSAKIQEEEAEKANNEGYSKHKPAIPLYNLTDAEKAISHFNHIEEGKWIPLFKGIQARFQYGGHIIGATFIELDINGKRFVFSGDIGRQKDILMYSPKKPLKADVLFIESTYGNKLHPDDDLTTKLKDIISHTLEKKGTLIIPSFAVERTQTLMYLLWQLQEKNAIPDIPVIMDSPMGANVLRIFHNYKEWHKLTPEDCTKMCKRLRVVREYRETWETIKNNLPKIIIAGSGMITGGRVLTYLQHYLSRPETTILLAGYQAEGTRGRQLLEGATELKIYGRSYSVKADIFNLEVLSAHADQSELIDWISELEAKPERVFIVHGETIAAQALKNEIESHYHWECIVPELFDIEEISLNRNIEKQNN